MLRSCNKLLSILLAHPYFHVTHAQLALTRWSRLFAAHHHPQHRCVLGAGRGGCGGTDGRPTHRQGFTGHPMGVSFEDVAAVEVLHRGVTPPTANNPSVDPVLVRDKKRFSRTCACPVLSPPRHKRARCVPPLLPWDEFDRPTESGMDRDGSFFYARVDMIKRCSTWRDFKVRAMGYSRCQIALESFRGWGRRKAEGPWGLFFGPGTCIERSRVGLCLSSSTPRCEAPQRFMDLPHTHPRCI